MKPVDPAVSIPLSPPLAHPSTAARSAAKLHETAKQFESVFMTEMLRLAHPPANAAGVFAPGHAEKSWQIFMDQALGQAAEAQGGAGLAPVIEKSLRAAQGLPNPAQHDQRYNGLRK
jgi:Rod binding domain-containing protein